MPAFVPSTFNAYRAEYYPLFDHYCRHKDTPKLDQAQVDRLVHMDTVVPAWGYAVQDQWLADHPFGPRCVG
jgi:hypothetical protein